MANYGIILTDDGNGGFYVSACNRGTTTTSFSGGTNLLTDTFTADSATGGLTTASGFLNTTNITGISSSDTFKRVLRGPLEAAIKAGEICANDRAFNL